MNELRTKIVASMQSGQTVSRLLKSLRMQLLKPEQICKFLPDQGVVYDLGCGFGLCSVAAAFNPRVHVIGYDIDAERIRENQRMFRDWENLEFQVGNLLAFNPAKEAHAIMIVDSLHYFPYEQQVQIVNSVWRKISPGGRLIVRDVVKDGSIKFRWNRFHEKTLVEVTKWTKSDSARCWFMDDSQWQALFSQLPNGELRARFACHRYLPYNDHLFVLDKIS